MPELLNSNTPVFIYPRYRKTKVRDNLGQVTEHYVHLDSGYVLFGNQTKHGTAVEGSFYVGSIDQILAVVHTLPDADESEPQTSLDSSQRVHYAYLSELEERTDEHRSVSGFEDPVSNWGSNGLLHWKAATREF